MELSLSNRQRSVRVNLPWLRKLSAAALETCLPLSGDGRFALRLHEEIDIAIVSDAEIARVHVEFMNIPGATDVITFDHGEIVVSAQTAEACAKEHRHSVNDELLLYMVHGFLHLNGYDDIKPTDRKRMHAVQERVWRQVLAESL